MQLNTTIAAIATPPGIGALSIVRLSGPDAYRIVQQCTHCELEPRRATLLRVQAAEGGDTLDECIATRYVAPASFTGEDVVELCCHGGALVTQLVLERLLACGAVPAEPGEFSRRAFENGRLDLTQAEAVMDIIHASGEQALRAAQSQLQGAICRPVQEAVNQLVDVTAHIEAYIDFPEEDIAPHTRHELAAGIDHVCNELHKLLNTAERGRILREGIRTVIIGAPNAGKSSLLNHLAGYDRAIVSPHAGTTRDTVEENLTIGGLCLKLIDTAGLRDTADEIELSGIERTMHAWQAADLVLEVADASLPPQALPHAPQNSAPRLLLLNKTDLPEHKAWLGKEGIRISCATGSGFDELEQAITGMFLQRGEAQETPAAINTRHRFALQQAVDALCRARGEFETEPAAPELISIDLRAALDALGSITGKVDTEDILTRIFSTFCLGK